MTRIDMIESIHDKLGLTKNDIALVIDEAFNIMKENILQGNDVKIQGFGNFLVKKRGRRMGRNLKTGEEKVIEPRNVVTFKPSRILKNSVNE